VRIPMRDGRTLGGTEFSNMHRVYEALPEDIKARLEGATATHDFEKFWEHMRQNHGSQRPALTEEQRRRRPPVSHPVLLTHPITGRKVLYCNPGYAIRVNELPDAESERLLEYLFAHQTQDKYRYTFHWTVGDVLVWDNFRCIHQAVADYGPTEHRLMKRCQVMASPVRFTAARRSEEPARCGTPRAWPKWATTGRTGTPLSMPIRARSSFSTRTRHNRSPPSFRSPR